MPGDFGDNTIFVWEFKHDTVNKKIIQIKYYALDEILGFIGGNLAIMTWAVALIMNPFAIIKFVV